ncbi:ester cyclase [Pseudomonas sp. KNUC1026]|uniref:ester cyclase n=1 Tax=Pseudomonas sp. KNUC1026 TaxID=2893890 RepID=UPI001F3DF292|nr:ester cyclase [Pseudomonas sp. KNUC1026]UFH51224.1 ester cyclase [Pseudomonas sp. KNUC1026]
MRTFLAIIFGTAAVACAASPDTYAAASPSLVAPAELVGGNAGNAAQVLAARRYASFWQSGDPALARAALAPGFMDRTLPPGRPQGIDGPLAASEAFHTAVPDLRCEIRQMIVSGDRVVSHLHFSGHFTGAFKGVQGKGQVVDFIATDIYRIADGRIAENWHLEDNLTFLQQIGLVPAG